MARCEDYPCCGHTDEDPCDWRGPSSADMLANPAKYHIGCDHEAGYCDYEVEDDDEDCCDICGEFGHDYLSCDEDINLVLA